MDPVLCFSLTSTAFGPVPTVLLVLLSGYWAWALFTKQPVERPVWKLLGVIGLVIGSSMLLGFDSNNAPVGGSGGTFGEMIAGGISANQLVGPTVFLLILAVLASLPVATDWFFLPTFTRMRASRALEAQPSLGSVGRYQVRGGYAHADSDEGGTAVLDEEEAEAEAEAEVAAEEVAVAVPDGVGPAFANDADEDESDDEDDEVAPGSSATLGLKQRVDSETATVEEASDETGDVEAESDVPWYSRRTRRPWYEQDADDRDEASEESDSLDYEDELVGDLENTSARHRVVDEGDVAEKETETEAEYEAADDEHEVESESAEEEADVEAEYEEEGEDEEDAEVEVEAEYEEEEEEEEEEDVDVEAEYEEEEEEEAETEVDAEHEEEEEEEAADVEVEAEYEEEDEAEAEVEAEYEEEEEEESAEAEYEDEAEPESDVEESADEVEAETSDDVATEHEVEPTSDPEELASIAGSAPDVATEASRAPARAADDELFLQAGDLAVDEGRASISFLQRSMGVGYFQAAKLLDRLQKEAIIGGYTGAVNRDVLVDKGAWAEKRSSYE